MSKLSLPKDRINVLLLENVHPNAVALLNRQGYTNVRHVRTALSGDALKDALADVHILGIRSRSQITEEALAAAEKLMAIGCFSIGTDQVNLQAAKIRGIPVFNAPYSNTRSVAELVLAEIICLFRGTFEKSWSAHEGGWMKSAEGSHEVRGKTLGIVGYGHIGSQLSILAEALGLRVVFYDIVEKLSLGNATALPSLDAVLETADVVSFHVPSSPLTRNMIGAAEIARMKPGARLINAARGNVVDIDALAQALRDGHLSGAAVDVFPKEPKGGNDMFESPLRGLRNVILTPHVGGSTEEAQANIGGEVAEKLVKYSDNGSTTGAVNFVEVSLPEHATVSRFLHIHKNVPGVLSAINDIFSSRGINIAGEYLRTDSDTGYVVVDVDADIEAGMGIRKALQAIPGTIRTRFLI
ncbi:phosphoglycerate dehydrogenase [Roseospira marina]|uniref:D-3-phosphoglycerate dehydrogenase n=1 Tax=Roseospira marina TaxID=140057 RepID=A0A5M6ICH3_9PROT|nr:phosphoglycerate dehydrogenase [Roseospira marina]KAA5605822.1 phosphoglycerate dehydrogenase [Roseospira marina]MBB4313640.1 D-3-phosphoglycerate dehydrogenase [Roseospira marina]MBB5086802.1 D-3-phosphoglycerate dehydrogenase [Roseospira marina]